MGARRALATLLALALLSSCAAPRAAHDSASAPVPPAHAGSGATSAAAPNEGDAALITGWSKLTQGASHADGLFRTFRKRDTLYLALREDQLGQQFLLITSFARGIGQYGLFGGLPAKFKRRITK